ncbi:THAP domain-containing protein 6 [Ornithorhynchus anatinus]|uniref:THAP domain containing 6 n=1 Tax=Ornithorhynchus anatinus TaxID=9258 RepID=A0A6I8N091_ORNAN|nr:THAP domain-containing protein 6 [Ornithorhynchus anatinus]
MVKCCSAVGCASRCLPNSKLKGLTFHVFPTDEKAKRKWVLAMKRLDVNAAGIWEPKKGDVLCSRHFEKADFDRSAPNVKLKPGVVPSVFDFPPHLQGRREKPHRKKKLAPKALPMAEPPLQLAGAASRLQEFRSQFVFEHSYSVMASPKKLKRQLDHVVSELEEAKESLRSALDRERRFRASLRTTVQELEDGRLISPQTAQRLVAFCRESPAQDRVS